VEDTADYFITVDEKAKIAELTEAARNGWNGSFSEWKKIYGTSSMEEDDSEEEAATPWKPWSIKASSARPSRPTPS
jgi:putative salt-induced outer membrane protein YdiY